MDKGLRLNIKGIIGFLTVAAILLWLWSFFRSYLLFAAILLMIAGVMLSAVGLWRVRGGMRAEIGAPRHRVGKNTEFPVDICFANPLRFAGVAIDVTYRCENIFTGSIEEKREKMWAAPRKGGKCRCLLNSNYAGRVRIRVEECRVYDFLHLFYLTYRAAEDGEVMVWTAFADGEETEERYSSIEGFPGESESRRRGVEYNPDYEIREYAAGDELKNIHWKLSAKQDKLMVRERLAAGREKVSVLLPLGDNPDENDVLMESLYGMCRLLLAKEYPVQLFWQGGRQQLCSRYIVEPGELENAMEEILSTYGIHAPGSAEAQMSMEHPAEPYLLCQPANGSGRGERMRPSDTVAKKSLRCEKVQESDRYDLFAAVTRALLLFLLVYGAAGGFLAAFGIEFHSGLCMLVFFALSFALSAIDETGKKWLVNLTTLLVFLLFLYMAVTEYWVINNGYYYMLNHIFEVARDYFDLSAGMEYTLIVEDGYRAVTTFAIFLGMVGIILLNIQMHNRCTLLKVMLLTLPPYVLPMYFACSPPLLYMIFLLTGYAAVMMLSYGRGRVSKQTRYILPAAAAAVALFVRALAFLIPEQNYARMVPQSEAKEASARGMENFARYGMRALFPQNTAGSGVSGGKLSKGSAIMPNYETALIVRYTPYSFTPVYLKAFTGLDYIGTSWTEAAMEPPEDGNMEMSLYSRQRQFEESGTAGQGMGIMEVEKTGAEDTFEYRPYYTDYCNIEEEGGTYTYRYYPDNGKTAIPSGEEPYMRYLNVSASCETAVRRICEEAGFSGTEEEIARQIVTYFDENYNYTLRPGFYYGNPDYISHFLLESRKGYCAHFASAATMLFRQMGIPARYVEGYAFSYANVVENGELVPGADYNDYYSGFSEIGATALVQIEIPEASAHAWVEIFDSERGWIVVDPTPSSAEEERTSFWDVFMRSEGGGTELALGEDILGGYIENALGVMGYVLFAVFLIAVILLMTIRTIRREKERRLPDRERVKLAYGRLQKAAVKKDRDFGMQRTLKEQLAWIRENCHVEISDEQEEALYQVFFAENIDYDCEKLCRELNSRLRMRDSDSCIFERFIVK